MLDMKTARPVCKTGPGRGDDALTTSVPLTSPTPRAQGAHPLYAPRFGSARILIHDGGFYTPHPAGAGAIVLGVPDCAGALVDIVAWRPGRPDAWWLRRGAATILGESEISRAADLGRPLYLCATPESWLFNHEPGGRWPAACVIDWRDVVGIQVALHGLTATCETRALAARLRRALERPAARVDVRGPGRAV